MNRRVSVFGNPDLPADSLPIRLVPKLAARFPDIDFVVEDPNELGIPETDEWVILDTVVGLSEIREIRVDELSSDTPRVTMHDYDLGTHLLLVRKLKPALSIRIFGIPENYEEDRALRGLTKLLETSAT